MKDHRKAEVINEITELALRYAGTQILHAHMERAVNSYIKEQDRDTRHACAEAVLQHRDAPALEIIGRCHAACMNVTAI